MTSMWDYQADVGRAGRDFVGYDVEATDGSIGKIDEASNEAGAAYLVVDTGFWIFGKKRMIPAGVVQRVDENDRKVYVGMSKAESSPPRTSTIRIATSGTRTTRTTSRSAPPMRRARTTRSSLKSRRRSGRPAPRPRLRAGGGGGGSERGEGGRGEGGGGRGSERRGGGGRGRGGGAGAGGEAEVGGADGGRVAETMGERA